MTMGETTATIPCSEAVRQLWDYLDRAIARGPGEGGASPLVLPSMLRGARVREGARTFLASGSSEEVPADVKEHLERFVEEL